MKLGGIKAEDVRKLQEGELGGDPDFRRGRRDPTGRDKKRV